MSLKPAEVYKLTPKEYTLLLEAQKERGLDEYERMADLAMMVEIAHRKERPKRSDLFKRPVDEEQAKVDIEKMAEQAQQASEWLSQFKF